MKIGKMHAGRIDMRGRTSNIKLVLSNNYVF